MFGHLVLPTAKSLLTFIVSFVKCHFKWLVGEAEERKIGRKRIRRRERRTFFEVVFFLILLVASGVPISSIFLLSRPLCLILCRSSSLSRTPSLYPSFFRAKRLELNTDDGRDGGNCNCNPVDAV